MKAETLTNMLVTIYIYTQKTQQKKEENHTILKKKKSFIIICAPHLSHVMKIVIKV